MEETWELAALDMASRPAIPAAMQRAIKEEAGYRCAVPTCRDKGPFDFEHIDPWAEVQKHEEHNIILLCVSCHARVTRGEMSKAAIKTYKRNLAITNGRYSLIEMRLLEEIYNLSLKNDSKSATLTDALSAGAILFVNQYEKLSLKGLERDEYLTFRLVHRDQNAPANVDPFFGPSEGSTELKNVVDENWPKDSSKFIQDFNNLLQNVALFAAIPTKAGVAFSKEYFGGSDLASND